MEFFYTGIPQAYVDLYKRISIVPDGRHDTRPLLQLIDYTLVSIWQISCSSFVRPRNFDLLSQLSQNDTLVTHLPHETVY